MNKTNMLIMVLGGALAATPAVAGGEYELLQFGGSGGVPFDDDCQLSHEFARGLVMRAATYVDQVAVVCIDRTGKLVTNGRYGGTGGVLHVTTCRSGYVLKGLRGRAARIVDRLGITCVEESDVEKEYDSSPDTLDFDYPLFGGTGGDYFSTRCGSGDGSIGIHGAAGTYVDRIGVWCKDTSF